MPPNKGGWMTVTYQSEMSEQELAEWITSGLIQNMAQLGIAHLTTEFIPADRAGRAVGKVTCRTKMGYEITLDVRVDMEE